MGLFWKDMLEKRYKDSLQTGPPCAKPFPRTKTVPSMGERPLADKLGAGPRHEGLTMANLGKTSESES